MNFKEWWGYGAYKKLWSLIGGRKWTHIYRDFYHTIPYAVQFIWFNVGLWVGLNYGWRFAYIAWGIYTIGFIYGHFHWSSYKPGEGIGGYKK